MNLFIIFKNSILVLTIPVAYLKYYKNLVLVCIFSVHTDCVLEMSVLNQSGEEQVSSYFFLNLSSLTLLLDPTPRQEKGAAKSVILRMSKKRI